jgi:hypothetical protein
MLAQIFPRHVLEYMAQQSTMESLVAANAAQQVLRKSSLDHTAVPVMMLGGGGAGGPGGTAAASSAAFPPGAVASAAAAAAPTNAIGSLARSHEEVWMDAHAWDCFVDTGVLLLSWVGSLDC